MKSKTIFIHIIHSIIVLLIYSFSISDGSFQNGMEGYSKDVDDKGRLISEGNYKNGQKDARWCYYFLIDSIFESQADQWDFSRKNLVQKEGEYIHGKRHNYWKYYFENRVLASEGWFSNGSKEKFWRYYQKDGQVLSEGHYSKNKKDGWWREFDPSKFEMIKGQYQSGVKFGYWQKYVKGERMAVLKYKNGMLLASWNSYEDYLNWKKD